MTLGLRHTALVAELLATLDALAPDLLTLDPLMELHDVSENDNTALRHVMAEFRVIANMPVTSQFCSSTTRQRAIPDMAIKMPGAVHRRATAWCARASRYLR